MYCKLVSDNQNDFFGTLTLLTLFMIIIDPIDGAKFRDFDDSKLIVSECPKMAIMKNVDKIKLLGFWYAYATTPLEFNGYERRCSSYNVKNSPYFKTNILHTNYNQLVITYACTLTQDKEMYKMKLRILTRTRTPMAETIEEAIQFLKKVDFPLDTLSWLKTEAFCFEWYQLNFETKIRPKHFQAPFNVPGER